MTRARSRTPDDEGSHSLTSMIDVVFLLLIFFVCSLNFRVIEGRLETELPQDRGNLVALETDLLEPIDVHVSVDLHQPGGLAVSVWGRPTPLANLARLVAGVRRSVPETQVRISTTADVMHGQVVAVLDEVLAGGAVRVLFAG